MTIESGRTGTAMRHRGVLRRGRPHIMASRFGNGIFEPLWNRNHIDHVQLIVAETDTVDRRSTTGIYVAMRLALDNWRWAGVPFCVRTGKALSARKSEIAIKFEHAPFALFRQTPVEQLPENLLLLRIQPKEGISLQFNAKVPGPQLNLDGVRMTFKYKDHFEAAASTGYETLLYDCMIGDATLFQRADNIEAGWRVVQPILEAWQELGERELPRYPAGSAGPTEADELMRRDGRSWRPLAADAGT